MQVNTLLIVHWVPKTSRSYIRILCMYLPVLDPYAVHMK